MRSFCTVPLCLALVASQARADGKIPAVIVLGASSSSSWRPIVQGFPQSAPCVILSTDSVTATLADADLDQQIGILANDVFSPTAKVETLAPSGTCNLAITEPHYVLAVDRPALFSITGRGNNGVYTVSRLANGPTELAQRSVPESFRAEYYLDRIFRGFTNQDVIPPCELECRAYHTYYVGARSAFSTVFKNLLALSDDRADVFPITSPEAQAKRATKLIITAAASGTAPIAGGPSCTRVFLNFDAARQQSHAWTLTCNSTVIPIGAPIARIQRDLIPKHCMDYATGYDLPATRGVAIAKNILLIYDDSAQQPVSILWKAGPGGDTCSASSNGYVFHSPLSLSQLTLKPVLNPYAPRIERKLLQKWISATLDEEFDEWGKAKRLMCTLYLASDRYLFSLSYPGGGFYTVHDLGLSTAQQAIGLEIARQRPQDDLSDLVKIADVTVNIPFNIDGEQTAALETPPVYTTALARSERASYAQRLQFLRELEAVRALAQSERESQRERLKVLRELDALKAFAKSPPTIAAGASMRGALLR